MSDRTNLMVARLDVLVNKVGGFWGEAAAPDRR
jgi:hypothetical protein